MPQNAAKVFKLQRAQGWVVVSVLTLSGLLLAYFIQHERSRTIQRERERLQTQVRAIEANLVQQLEGIDAALLSMRPEGGLSAVDASVNQARSAKLSVLEHAMPAVRAMLMVDARGRALSSSRPEVLGFDASQRAYFLTAKRQPRANALYVSAPFTTSLNVYALNLVKAWLDDENQLLGITTATLDPEYFKVLLQSVLYADDMRATLVHGDGLAFLTVPGNQVIQGSDLNRPGTLFTRHVASGNVESVFINQPAMTGDLRLVIYRTVWPASLSMDKPLLLAVSRDMDAVLAPWRQLAMVLGLTYAGLCGLSLLGMYVLGRKQRALEELTRTHAQEAREQAERLELALAGGELGLFDLDIPSGMRRVNARAKEMVGDAPDGPVDSFDEWSARVHPDDQPVARASRLAYERGETDVVPVLEYRVRHKDGHWVWIQSRGRITLRAADGTPLRWVGVYQDISERKMAEALIAEFAFYDPLTKLPNRRLLMDRLVQAQSASARNGQAAALLFMDLDRFKWVNDTMGHDMGDLLLQEVARRLLASVRKSDTVARLGGDEFVLVLEQLGDSGEAAQAHATQMAEKILSSLREPLQLGEQLHYLTCSMGIAVFEGAAQTPAQLLKQADQALYLAKGAGRNQTAVYSAEASP